MIGVAAAFVCLASMAAGFTGFGFNLVAAPLLALVVSPTKDAVVIALVLGVMVSSLSAFVARTDKAIDYRALLLLSLGSIPGVIVGATVFATTSSEILRVVIGVTVALSALAVHLATKFTQHPTRTAESLGVGALGGGLAVVTGTGGPPVFAYLTLTCSTPAKVRGTILAHVAVVSAAALLGLTLRGSLALPQLEASARLAPAALVGVIVGTRLFSIAPARTYRRTVYAALLLVGVLGCFVATR